MNGKIRRQVRYKKKVGSIHEEAMNSYMSKLASSKMKLAYQPLLKKQLGVVDTAQKSIPFGGEDVCLSYFIGRTYLKITGMHVVCQNQP